METLGDQLETLVAAATQEVLFVAPYIKVSSLARLVDACRGDVAITVVTRWRLDEIAAGVCDLEIWPLLNKRGATLWLHPALHAKYYRADRRLAVGSANLTGLGLGWRPDANLEILVEATSLSRNLEDFEPSLWTRAIRVDDKLYEQFIAAAAAFENASVDAPVMTIPDRALPPFEAWRPGLRYPEDLLRLYAGRAVDLTAAARETATEDLGVLAPPAGLNEGQLKAWIGARLRTHPEMRAIHEVSDVPRRFGEMKALLRSRGAQDPGRAWQTWMRWIAFVFPGDYDAREANYSEIFKRRVRN